MISSDTVLLKNPNIICLVWIMEVEHICHTVHFISPKTKQNVKKKLILVGVITSFVLESKNAHLKFEDTFFTIGVLCMILNFSQQSFFFAHCSIPRANLARIVQILLLFWELLVNEVND